MATDEERLAAAVPAEVREVCRVLTEAGHQAVTVGGAVRDALLGRPAGDWDVATSAHPDQVIAAFPRTIPTGVQHGTVTVMIGRGDRRIGVEVTTFRGEGAYSDARRPDSVTFGVPLDEDLARRDLVVNAIAFDPITGEIHDPFGGRADLAARILRAVGDPVARFTEDGLRVLRAVRFAATLEFALDPATEAAFAPALPSLQKVSQERVKVELWKLLGAPRPSRGLEIARRSGVLMTVLPEVAGCADADWARTLAWVDAAPGVLVRLAALLSAMPEARLADPVMRRLKTSTEERDQAIRLTEVALQPLVPPPALRRVLRRVSRPYLPLAVDLWHARDDDGAVLATEARAIAARGDALTVNELAIGGADLQSELGMAPGKPMGILLARLLEEVLDDPTLNDRARLLERARAPGAAP
jgi:tRNA nucleotidyltransferase (CCA-adding enzyme)